MIFKNKNSLKNNSIQSNKSIHPEIVVLSTGIIWYLTFNLSTLLGFLIFNAVSNLIIVPVSLVLAGSFIGFLVDQFIKNETDRSLIIILSLISFLLAKFIDAANLLIILMLMGALLGMFQYTLQTKSISPYEKNNSLGSVE